MSYDLESKLEAIGKDYHEHRRQLMLCLQIGLTETYNLFHKKDFSIADVENESKQPTPICEKGYKDILKLRELHVEMDKAVLSAYCWTDINLAHDFYEVDYLPENDRIRFTISPDARREVLKRLLQLNHEIHEQEVNAGLWEKKKAVKTKTIKPDETIIPLLPEIDTRVLAATSYPFTATDKTICAASLSIVEQANGLPSMDHLDALLLATHPEWCRIFLERNDHTGFNKAVASVQKELFIAKGQSVDWSGCRSYLEDKRRGIKVDHAQIDQPIIMGDNFIKVKNTFPKGTEKIVAYSLKALKHMRDVRKELLLSQEQQNILHIFEQQHKLFALVA